MSPENAHPSVHPVDSAREERASYGQRLAERMARFIGSWRFIIAQNLVMLAWVLLNITGLALHWDPYPFILLNLVLSTQAAETGPILLLAANRQGERDRQLAVHTYETEVTIKADLALNTAHTLETHERLLRIEAALAQLTQKTPVEA